MSGPGQQMLLDVGPEPAPTLENFVAGSNQEALAHLQGFDALGFKERFVHLYGESGSGRTHLLRALCERHGGTYLAAATLPHDSQADPEARFYAIDDVDLLDRAGQAWLFNLINECRSHAQQSVVTSARQAPMYLNLREDLRTRLGWGLVLRLERLDDASIEAALMTHAKERGVDLPTEVSRYLLTREQRDVRSLTRLIDELDRYALASHRALTVPLVRAFMAERHRDPHAS